MNQAFMREAIQISLRTMRCDRGGPFGAVIARHGQVVGRGWNKVTTTNDPTAHAEVIAIREACRVLKTFRLDDCEIYTSCEPCPMCLGAIYWARLRRLFFAASRDDAAQAGFDDELIYREIGLSFSRRRLPTRQLLREQARAVLLEWRAKPDKIPY